MNCQLMDKITMQKQKLILLPNSLCPNQFDKNLFPIMLEKTIKNLDCLIAENRKNGIKYLLNFLPKEKANSIEIFELNEHKNEKDILDLIDLIKNKTQIGLISDQGLPAIADPGADLVYLARKNKFIIEAIPGPSSIFLALMQSGFCGQRFSFEGYLPKDSSKLIYTIRDLEKKSLKQDKTYVFIETPYRSDKLLQTLIKNLSNNTKLCIATNLTCSDQEIISKKIDDWKISNHIIGKKPTIFLIYSSINKPKIKKRFTKKNIY